MTEMTMARLDEWMIILYAVSLVFYFTDYVKRNTYLHYCAVFLFAVVFIMQTTTIVSSIVQNSRLPIYTLLDGVYIVAWLLLLVSLLFYTFHSYNLILFVMNVIAFIFMTIHTFGVAQRASSRVSEMLISELLLVHIVFAFIAYVAFAFAFAFAILYLLVYRLLKKKIWTKQFDRYPSLHQTTLGMKRSIYAGIPLLFISLLFGLQWAQVALDEWSMIDPKIWMSFLVVGVYSGLVYLKKIDRLRANDFAWSVIIAFLFVLVNFFVASQWSSFHYWM